MIKVKCGAITKTISKGALEWYLTAGWKIIEEKEEEDDETNTKKTTPS